MTSATVPPNTGSSPSGRPILTTASSAVLGLLLVIVIVAGAQGATSPMSVASWLGVAVLVTTTVLTPQARWLAAGGAMLALVSISWWHGSDPASVAEAGAALLTAAAVLGLHAANRDRAAPVEWEARRSRGDALAMKLAGVERRAREQERELRRVTTALEEARAAMARVEQMALTGRLAAGFAHDLASPLMAVTSSLEELSTLRAEHARSIGDARVSTDEHAAIARDTDELIELASTAASRAVTLVRSMRARGLDSQSVETFEVGPVLRAAAGMLEACARAAGVRVLVEDAAPAFVRGCPSRLNQAITNLVHNAVDAIATAARPGSVRVMTRREGKIVVIEVADDGPGIAPDVLPHVFEPHFTTKPDGHGTGLGLAIVSQVVREELGGDIAIATTPGGGSTFIVRIARAERSGDGT